jgi:hypothetical protein
VGFYGQGTSEFTFAEGWNGHSWSMQVTPNPPSFIAGVTDAILSGVSCTSSKFCEAVGAYVNSTGQVVPLAAQFDGKSWTMQSPPGPAGAASAVLSGVSCVSRKFCEATSTTQRFSTTAPFADAWNGKSWQLQPLPASVTQSVGQVSCASATFCEAVGPATGAASATAAVWNGMSWASQAVPAPAGAAFSNLSGVSCVSATFCETVGSYTDSSAASFSWTAEWNGSSWSVQSIPGQPGAFLTTVAAVSCSSTTACEAGGSFQQSSQAQISQALAEAWNGSSWNLQQAARPAGETSNSLNAVSCLATTFCEAVGSYTDASGIQVSLAEQWNGTSWQLQQISSPAQGEGLFSVSCAGANFCEAVGSAQGEPAAQMWNGTSWTAQAVPGADFLISVSCTSATFCMAVGNNAVTETWKGTIWSVTTGPAGFGSLGSVSCVAADFCEAVGIGPAGNGAAAAWNGTSWAPQSTPIPVGEDSLGLNSVSCVSQQFCMTAGDASSSTGFGSVTAAEVWDGTAWVVQPTPNPASGSTNSLNGVSCTSATNCAAVGNSAFAANALAMVWDGTTWSLRSTPNVASASSNNFFGVSCQPTTCTAVGDTFTVVDQTLVESGS